MRSETQTLDFNTYELQRLNRGWCAGSVCRMKRNTHTIVPENKFQLLQGREMLTEYRVRCF